MILDTHNETILTCLTSWDTQVKNVMPYCFEEKKMTEPGTIPKEGDMRKKNVWCCTIANALTRALCTCIRVQVLLRERRGQEKKRKVKQEKTERKPKGRNHYLITQRFYIWSCLDCRFLILANMSRCPAEYCSITSITS